MYEIKQPKLYMLDWKKLKVFDNTTHDADYHPTRIS